METKLWLQRNKSIKSWLYWEPNEHSLKLNSPMWIGALKSYLIKEVKFFMIKYQRGIKVTHL